VNDLNGLMARYPEVQLATLVREPPEGTGWLHEIKFDGYRLLGFTVAGTVCLRTRNGKDWTPKFPSLAADLKELKVKDAVLDMEAVALTGDGKSSFHALQAALGEGWNAALIVAYVFDLLYLDGKDLTTRPLHERKQMLKTLLTRSKSARALRYTESVAGDGRRVFAKSCDMGLEGIVSKKTEAPYIAGRAGSWLKSKCGQRQEFIIIGYSDARKGGRALGALYLGYHKNGEMKYAGKVGTGFTMQSANDLRERLERLDRKKAILMRTETANVPAREWQTIHWVKPELLCEVAFTEWTQDGQLRHPSFQGLREDKDEAGVTKEKSVAG
jgi:bifunctional non-homologous end joining protein LigD